AAAMDERAAGAEGDDRGADAAGDEARCGGVGGIGAVDGDAGQGFGFGLVRGEVVAKRKGGIGHVSTGGGVEDGGHAGSTGDLESAGGGFERLFELGDEDCGAGDQVGLGVEVGGSDGGGG